MRPALRLPRGPNDKIPALRAGSFPLVFLHLMLLARSGEMPLHDRFGRAAHGTFNARKSAQTLPRGCD
jgi:hypothetical protein